MVEVIKTGKKSRERMLGEKADRMYKKYWSRLKEIIDKYGELKADNGVIKFLSPTKLLVIPTDGSNINEFHIRFIKKLEKRHLYNRLKCYINWDNEGVILEA